MTISNLRPLLCVWFTDQQAPVRMPPDATSVSGPANHHPSSPGLIMSRFYELVAAVAAANPVQRLLPSVINDADTNPISNSEMRLESPKYKIMTLGHSYCENNMDWNYCDSLPLTSSSRS